MGELQINTFFIAFLLILLLGYSSTTNQNSEENVEKDGENSETNQPKGPTRFGNLLNTVGRWGTMALAMQTVGLAHSARPVGVEWNTGTGNAPPMLHNPNVNAKQGHQHPNLVLGFKEPIQGGFPQNHKHLKNHRHRQLKEDANGGSCCGEGWQHFGDNCYKVVHSPTIEYSFEDAHNNCTNLGDGSELVSIHSQPEQNFVAGLVEEAAKHNGNVSEIEGRNYFWTGLRMKWAGVRDKAKGIIGDNRRPANAYWSDGTPTDFGNPTHESRGQLPWSTDEPDDRWGNESCMMMHGQGEWAGQWSDTRCINTRKYYNVHGMVCKRQHPPQCDADNDDAVAQPPKQP